jgi:diguanylate cyclase (GGDEF)-like protein
VAGGLHVGLHVEPVCETEARVRALCPDAQGRVWVGTSAGLHLLADGALPTTWTREDGLPAKEVWAVCADRAGRVWAGTSTGLALVADQTAPVRTLPPSRDALAGPIYAFAPDGPGRLWLATESGLRAVDPASGAPLPVPPLPAPLAGETVWALQVDHRGRLWAGTDRHGVWALDPQNGTVQAHLAPTTQVPVLCLLGDGTLCASLTGDGLVAIDVETGKVRWRIGPTEGLPEANVQGLAADQQGRLWAGTWSGWLACVDTTRGVIMRTLALADDHTPRPITDLTCAADGLLWVSTYGGGLVCLDPAQAVIVRVLSARDALPSDLLYACRADGQGRLWVGTRRGVACLTPQTGRCITLGRSLGLPSEECNSHALYLDAQDQLWVGTVQGPAIVRTAHVPAVVPPSTVALTGLTVLGQERPLAPELRLDETEYDLTVSYGAVTFTAAPQVVYRVWLEGLEPTWSAPTAHRVARYTNLRPGRYTFRVAARNWGGQWSAPAELPFEVVRNRARQEMDEALERARIDKEVALATAARLAELNRQLEDTDRLKTQLISQIRDQAALFERLSQQDGLTGLLNRRALDERLAEEFARARHQRPLSVVLADLDHFKRINDTYSHQVGDQVLKVVAQLGQEVVRRSDSLGRYGGEEFMLVLPETTAAQARELCERWRARIAAYDWAPIAAGLRVTLSCGLTDDIAVPHHERLVAHADQALYQAKNGGRNRTCGRNEGRGHTPAA